MFACIKQIASSLDCSPDIRIMQNARCFILIGGQSRECSVTNRPMEMHGYCDVGKTVGIPGFCDAKITNDIALLGSVTNGPMKMHGYCDVGKTFGIPGFCDAKRANDTSKYQSTLFCIHGIGFLKIKRFVSLNVKKEC